MSTVRIALANIEFPATPEQSVKLADDAIAQASAAGADIICFPECFVPRYRGMGKQVASPGAEFLERAWSLTAKAAAKGNIAVVLGTERVVNDGLRISALVINRDGTVAGFQDKVQLDPSDEEDIYSPGSERRVFQIGALTFGIAICHEGFRYPETVRWAVRQGAQLVFHPHFDETAALPSRSSMNVRPASSLWIKSMPMTPSGAQLSYPFRNARACSLHRAQPNDHVDHPSIVGLPTLGGRTLEAFSMGYGVRLGGSNLEIGSAVCLMGMSQILTALFAVAAFVVAYHLGLQEGLSHNAKATTAQREDPSDLRACREH